MQATVWSRQQIGIMNYECVVNKKTERQQQQQQREEDELEQQKTNGKWVRHANC